MSEVKEFCDKAKEKGILFNSMVGCIIALQSGRRMTEKEREACNFLGEPNTFWNNLDGNAMDYNWFLDNRDEIRQQLA